MMITNMRVDLGKHIKGVKMKRKLFIFTLLLICQPAFAWSGYDYNKSCFIDVSEDREDIRVGDTISVFDYCSSEYKYYTVVYIDDNELTVKNPKTGYRRTFDMDDD